VSQEEIKDLVLANLGFQQNNLFKSIFMVVATFGLVVLLIGGFVLFRKYCFDELPDNVKKVFSSIKNKLMFNSVLRTLLQTYLSLCVSCLVSLKYSEAASDRVTGIILLLLVSMTPFIVA